MAEFYKILKADPMGDPYTPNQPGAKPILSYWCQVEGQDKAVMIGKQVRDDGQPALVPGQHVYGNLMYAKSQKGNEYWKFKSEQVPQGVQRPADSPAQATAQQATGAQAYGEQWAASNGAVPQWFIPYGNMIDYIYKEMKKMDADEPQEAQLDLSEVETIKDATAPLDEETKAKLDEIFGPLPEDD